MRNDMDCQKKLKTGKWSSYLKKKALPDIIGTYSAV
jgi:hypothetical protein